MINESNSDYFKVGYSKNAPDARVKELQTGNPRTLRLVRYVMIDDAYRVEQLLHNVLGKWHVRNEWFCITQSELHTAMMLFDAVITKKKGK